MGMKYKKKNEDMKITQKNLLKRFFDWKKF